MQVRIGNGAGFWGDNLDAPVWLAATGQLDYLTLEYLAELTMSILARLREKNPQAGYATDFLSVLERLCPTLADQSQLRVVTNAGGVNPHACACAAGEILQAAGLGDARIGVVSGDDLLPRLEELQADGCDLAHLDTGAPLSSLEPRIVSANAYLGAPPIVQALAADARVVVTGRVADASLTVGPAVHDLGWEWDDYPALAAGTVAGHLIECGAQVTGGLLQRWADLELAAVGYPIAEIDTDGSSVITKPQDSGGVVNRETVVEQLVYEIGDPAHYLTPDVDADFTGVRVSEIGPDRVQVTGASGGPPPDAYKVSLAYHDGFTASGQILVYGKDCVAKARACAAMVNERVERVGYALDAFHVECLGAGAGVPGVSEAPANLREVMLRMTVRDSRREAVERFAKEIAPLITSGPAGLAGYATARAQVRPVFAYWPTLVSKELVQPACEVRTAAEWARANRAKP